MKKIKLEEGMTARIEGGYVVIEEAKVEKRFKAGDCVIGELSNLPSKAKMVEYVRDGYVCRYDNDSNGCSFKWLRLATESERKQLMSDLASKGKRWDAEKMQIVDLEFIPKAGDVVTDNDGAIYIFKDKTSDRHHEFYAALYKGAFYVDKTSSYKTMRPATREERSEFFARLVKEGYKWNAKKLKLTWAEDKWVPKDGDFVHCVWNGGRGTIIMKGAYRGVNDYIEFYAQLTSDGFCLNGSIGTENQRVDRNPTEYEKAELLAAIAKDGKQWNSELKRVEDIKPKYKAGNIVTCADASIVILGAEMSGGSHQNLASLLHNEKLEIHPAGSASVTGDFIRGLCAASDADRMHKALKEHGKVWNAGKKQIENLAVEMTMEQVCEKLGMNVKIVKK